MAVKDIVVGNRTIGAGHPTFIIAELGYNFLTTDEALASVDAAAECGVDAIKVQTFRAETVTARNVDFPDEAGGENQFEEFKRYEISEEVHQIICGRAAERGLIFCSTPSYRDDVDLLERLQVPVHKVGSDDLTNLPFIDYVGRTGKPIIFSSGMGTLGEVDEAIRTYQAARNDQLVLLQCVSNYPLEDPSLLNLRVLQTYAQAFPVHVGLSDHSITNTSAVAAVALGARVVEKHFTLNKKMAVPDAFFSADPNELKALVLAVREVEQLLGDGFKAPVASEWEMRSATRKSLISRRTLPIGHCITEHDVIIKRPGYGIAPSLLPVLLGREVRVEIPEDTPITWEVV
jgi:sialic acid synthase SpsE